MLIAKGLCGVMVIAAIGMILLWVLSGYVGGEARVLDAGHLQVEATTVQLVGVDAPGLTQSCRFAGQAWECGIRAAEELSRWIGDRGVRCLTQGHDEAGRAVGVCYAGTEDVGAWLVKHGWAVADSHTSSRYLPQERRAREGLEGLWRSQFTLPRVLRMQHGGVVIDRGEPGTLGSRVPEHEAQTRGKWFGWTMLGALGVCLGVFARWFRRRRSHSERAHAWRITRSRALIEKIREIGRQRGPGAQFAYLRKVDPWVVEELVLSALEAQGVRVRRNARYTGDGGIDGRCWIDGVLHLIQVKRYGCYISAEDVREFRARCGRLQAMGLFVHTGRTGPSAAALATAEVRIISGGKLLRLLGVSHTQSEGVVLGSELEGEHSLAADAVRGAPGPRTKRGGPRSVTPRG
jgi:restriction system protein